MRLIPKEIDKAEELRVLKQVVEQVKLAAAEKYTIGGNIVQFDEFKELSLTDYLFRPIDAESL